MNVHSADLPNLPGSLKPILVSLLAKYDGIIASYRANSLSGLAETLERLRAPHLSLWEEMETLHLFTSYLAESGLFSEDNPMVGLRVLFARSCQCFSGVRACLQEGLPGEASILLRSLFENYLNQSIILQSNAEKRDLLFLEYRHVEQYKDLEWCRKARRNGRLSEESFRKRFPTSSEEGIQAAYDQVRVNYSTNLKSHWSWQVVNEKDPNACVTIFDVAVHVGHADDYQSLYSTLSTVSHGSSRAGGIVRTVGGISMAPRFGELIDTLGRLAIGYLTRTICNLCTSLKNPAATEITTYLIARAVINGAGEPGQR